MPSSSALIVLERQIARLERAKLSRVPSSRMRVISRSPGSIAHSWFSWQASCAGEKTHLIIVQHDTALRWNRDLFRHYWRRRSRSRAQYGRPPLIEDVVALIKQTTRENTTWGAERIRGGLSKVGIEVGKSSTQKAMADVRKHRA